MSGKLLIIVPPANIGRSLSMLTTDSTTMRRPPYLEPSKLRIESVNNKSGAYRLYKPLPLSLSPSNQQLPPASSTSSTITIGTDCADVESDDELLPLSSAVDFSMSAGEKPKHGLTLDDSDDELSDEEADEMVEQVEEREFWRDLWPAELMEIEDAALGVGVAFVELDDAVCSR